MDYAAPEQISSRRVDGRADQHALGCAAFEMLSGEPPFLRDHSMAMLAAHLSQPPPRLSATRARLPADADAVFARALAKSPDDRYGGCGEFSDALRDALGLGRYEAGPRASHPRTEVAAIPPILGQQLGSPTPQQFPSRWDATTPERRPPGAGRSRSPPGCVVVVDWTQSSKPDAFTDWQHQSAAKAAADSSYHLISIRRVSYRGYNTAEWEFTDNYPASQDQFLDRGFIVHPGTLGFAIEWRKLVTSFDPAS